MSSTAGCGASSIGTGGRASTVIVSHGAPVHSRAEYARALGRPPWRGAAESTG
jgi:hypothetical protein